MVCGELIAEVYGRGVDEGETERSGTGAAICMDGDVDGGGPDESGMDRRALDKLGDGRKLVWGRRGSDDACVEQQTEKGRLSYSSALMRTRGRAQRHGKAHSPPRQPATSKVNSEAGLPSRIQAGKVSIDREEQRGQERS